MSVRLRSKQLKGGKVSLWLDVYHKGSRKAEFLGITLTGNREEDKVLKRIAKDQAKKRQVELLNDRYNFEETTRNMVALVRSIAAQKSEGTATTLLQFLRYWIEFAGDVREMSSITNQDCEGFKSFLLSSELSTNTANLYFGRFQQVLRYAVENQLMSRNPARGIKVKKEETSPRFLTASDLKRLVNTECPNDEIKRSFLFSCCTGLRISDIQRLRWTDIKITYLEIRQQKTDRINRVPLSPSACRILDSIDRIDDFVFHLPVRWIRVDAMERWAEDADIPRFTFHASRHSFAMLLVRSKVDILTISKLMGHTSIQTSLQYARIQDEDVER